MNIRMKKKHMYKDTWNLNYYIAKFILPRLKLFKKVTMGFPCDLKSINEWYDILDKIIAAFKILSTDEINTQDEQKIVNEGLDLSKISRNTPCFSYGDVAAFGC